METTERKEVDMNGANAKWLFELKKRNIQDQTYSILSCFACIRQFRPLSINFCHFQQLSMVGFEPLSSGVGSSYSPSIRNLHWIHSNAFNAKHLLTINWD